MPWLQKERLWEVALSEPALPETTQQRGSRQGGIFNDCKRDSIASLLHTVGGGFDLARQFICSSLMGICTWALVGKCKSPFFDLTLNQTGGYFNFDRLPVLTSLCNCPSAHCNKLIDPHAQIAGCNFAAEVNHVLDSGRTVSCCSALQLQHAVFDDQILQP